MDIKKKKKKKKSNNKNVSLPPELIEEILLRLPVKSLVRFRCVSKQWLSQIADTHFTKSHFDVADAAPTNNKRLLYLTLKPGHWARCVDVEASVPRDYAVSRIRVPSYSDLRIIGSCRGFILLENNLHEPLHEPRLILWNPLTGVHKTLPYPDRSGHLGRRECLSSSDFCWYGFGHDESSDDYLVVRVWHKALKTNEFESYWEFFSVRTNSWREIASAHFPYVTGFVICNSGLFFNGAIHWLAVTGKHGGVRATGPTATAIVTFDLMGKNLSKIPLPAVQGGSFCRLKVLGGWLAVCYSEFSKIEIWVMKEYKLESTWTRHIVVFPSDRMAITPLCFANGGELVATIDSGRLVKINDKGRWVELQPGYLGNRMMVVFTENLLSLPGSLGKQGKMIIDH